MKFFAPLVVGVIAFLSSDVDANGVCYDPNHGTGMDASSVQTDMQTIANHGFDSVRTFISKFGNTELGPIIAAAGLKAMLGVPYPQSDYQDQMAAAIKAAQSGGVYAIMVGNENLAGVSSVPSDMIDVINQIKSQVPGGVLVGTVQRNTEVIGHESVSGWSDLVSACDVLGVNAHPYFSPGTTADAAIKVLDNQWQTMVGTFGDKLVLTETGWPSEGSLMGNVGSVAGAETFYNAYQQWSSSMSEKFYFQMFDTPYRSEQYEKTFGVVTSAAQDKFSISAQVSVSVSIGGNQGNQQQQNPSTETPTYQQQTPSTDAPYQQTPGSEAPGTEAPYQQTPVTEAPTQAPTEAPTQAPTEVPTAAPTPVVTPASTEAPVATPASTEAPVATPASTEAPVATPVATLAPVPTTETPSIVQSSGSVDRNTTSGSYPAEQGSASIESSKPSDNEQHPGKTGTTQQQQTAQTAGTNSQQDDTQQANTQSSGGGAGSTVAFALAGGACAALVAFGFIYQSRKRAAELEAAEAKDNGFTVTPIQGHCAL